MPEVTVTTPIRPVRALLLVPTVTDIDWRVSMTAALRAQATIWGGQGNLPVPCTDDALDNPLFWRICNMLDPDAVLVHSGFWADLADLAPQYHAEHMERRRETLSKELPPDAVAEVLARHDEQPLIGGGLPDKWNSMLCERGALFNHDGTPEMCFVTADGDSSWPLVSALKLRQPDDLPAVHQWTCDFSLNGNLALAAWHGQFSTTVLDRLKLAHWVIGTATATDATKLREKYIARVNDADGRTPFAVSQTGLGWFRRPLRRGRGVVVVGDDVWDFVVAYALFRVTGAAWWLPAEFAKDQEWLWSLAQLLRPRAPGEDLLITSASDDELAQATADSIRAIDLLDRSTRVIAISDVWPDTPDAQRLLCTAGANRTSRMGTDDDGCIAIETPVPAVRTHTDPLDMTWVTDVGVTGWSAPRDSYLAGALVRGSGLSSARMSAFGVSYQCPSGLIQQGVELEAQVPRPLLHLATVHDQVAAIAEKAGLTAEPSDKGIYTLGTATLLGGIDKLIDRVTDPAWLSFLQAASRERGKRPGTHQRSDKRRYFAKAEVDALLQQVALTVTTAELVRDGVLARGLLHTCPICRWTGFFGQQELGRDLRCSRCRREMSLDSDGWYAAEEPVWMYRLHELLWQFMSHHSDLALRAAGRFLRPERASGIQWNVGVETAVTSSAGRLLGETDICVVVGGALWIGEAKVGSFGSESTFRQQLKRLAKVARALRADHVLFVTDRQPASTNARKLIGELFPGVWPTVRIECLTSGSSS